MANFRLRQWARLRFLIINGHVGAGFVNGVLARALRIWPMVDVILIQEGRHANKWKHDAKGKFDWFPEPRTKDQPMTYVLTRKSRFTVMGEERTNIDHGGQYPRELNGALVLDKKTNQYYSISSFHVDPLGKGYARADANARKHQTQQTDEFVDWHASCNSNVLPFSGGDTNNWLPTTTEPGSVRHQFKSIRMTPLFTHLKRPGTVNLMELFARFGPMVKAVSRRYRWIHVKGMDHGVVYAVVKVRILSPN